MKVAILESILMPAGHEIEFDRILVEEIQAAGHEVCFFAPPNFQFKVDYKVPVIELAGGEAISYAGIGPFKKILLSTQRGRRRKQWFNDAYNKAKQGMCDMIIVPTASYRYTNSLLGSSLKDSPVPVVFIMHGIIPSQKQQFISAVKKSLPYKNIHFVVITLRDDFAGESLRNLHLFAPPVYIPRHLQGKPSFTQHTPLRIGFFGQYRREKNLEFFLKAFEQARFSVPVELIVQGATAKPEDANDFTRLTEEYKKLPSVRFWHKNLIGAEWEQALLDVDVILMPYAAERYRYQTSAMLFTALGFNKPVLLSPEINPEVLHNYQVGEAVRLDSPSTFANQLSAFVNDFAVNARKYEYNLEKANVAYSPESFVKNILKLKDI